ncbi:hypothetical protein [Aquimarina latercula]|uniref:hypothetical protein n=1 Tax=Aquimarina latercula TaxID=987 RepID=UPI0003FE1140|nr:hypothetical protein [Aquimarina latercula]
MKNFALVLMTILTTSFTTINTETYDIDYNATEVKAEFVGKSEKSLYFRKADDSKMMEFTIVSMNILSKYDFNDKANIGKIFNITYEVQKLETLIKDPKNDGARVSQFVERKILMKVEKIK